MTMTSEDAHFTGAKRTKNMQPVKQIQLSLCKSKLKFECLKDRLRFNVQYMSFLIIFKTLSHVTSSICRLRITDTQDMEPEC